MRGLAVVLGICFVAVAIQATKLQNGGRRSGSGVRSGMRATGNRIANFLRGGTSGGGSTQHKHAQANQTSGKQYTNQGNAYAYGHHKSNNVPNSANWAQLRNTTCTHLYSMCLSKGASNMPTSTPNQQSCNCNGNFASMNANTRKGLEETITRVQQLDDKLHAGLKSLGAKIEKLMHMGKSKCHGGMGMGMNQDDDMCGISKKHMYAMYKGMHTKHHGMGHMSGKGKRNKMGSSWRKPGHTYGGKSNVKQIPHHFFKKCPKSGALLTFVTKPHSWSNARDYCQQHGMSLVNIWSQEQNDDLRKKIHEDDDLKAESTEGFWLGANDTTSDHSLQWQVPKHKQMTYTNFASNDHRDNPSLGHCLWMCSQCNWRRSQCAKERNFICVQHKKKMGHIHKAWKQMFASRRHGKHGKHHIKKPQQHHWRQGSEEDKKDKEHNKVFGNKYEMMKKFKCMVKKMMGMKMMMKQMMMKKMMMKKMMMKKMMMGHTMNPMNSMMGGMMNGMGGWGMMGNSHMGKPCMWRKQMYGGNGGDDYDDDDDTQMYNMGMQDDDDDEKVRRGGMFGYGNNEDSDEDENNEDSHEDVSNEDSHEDESNESNEGDDDDYDEEDDDGDYDDADYEDADDEDADYYDADDGTNNTSDGMDDTDTGDADDGSGDADGNPQPEYTNSN